MNSQDYFGVVLCLYIRFPGRPYCSLSLLKGGL